ncbi:MAG: hypothetical protein GY730_01175 [bacterium]|nr:hypothetical protein [bacterium]
MINLLFKKTNLFFVGIAFIFTTSIIFAQQFPLGDKGKPDDYNHTIKQITPQFRGLDKTKKSLPSYFNWKDEGVVTPAKDQGGCGSCWAFAAVGVFESKLLMNGQGLFDISEEQQLVCNTSMDGCEGGYISALRFWENIGPMDESCTGYTDIEGETKCADLSTCPQYLYRLIGYYTVDMRKNINIKTSLYNDGPAAFRFDTYSDFHTYWRTGTPGQVYTHRSGDIVGGHAVLVIGWDDNKQAWLCKNSWGRTKGPNGDGTFWISYKGPVET